MKTVRSCLLILVCVSLVSAAAPETKKPPAAPLLNDAGHGSVSGQFLLDGVIPPVEILVKKGDPAAKDGAVCAAVDLVSDTLVVDPSTEFHEPLGVVVEVTDAQLRALQQRSVEGLLRNVDPKSGPCAVVGRGWHDATRCCYLWSWTNPVDSGSSCGTSVAACLRVLWATFDTVRSLCSRVREGISSDYRARGPGTIPDSPSPFPWSSVPDEGNPCKIERSSRYRADHGEESRHIFTIPAQRMVPNRCMLMKVGFRCGPNLLILLQMGGDHIRGDRLAKSRKVLKNIEKSRKI